MNAIQDVAVDERKDGHRRSRRPLLLRIVLFTMAGYALPFLLLTPVSAAPFPCAGTGLCNSRIYEGNQTYNSLYAYIQGAIGVPPHTMADPAHDGVAHWLGLTHNLPPGYMGPGENLQAGASGGSITPGTFNSNYVWYSEFTSWCLGYQPGVNHGAVTTYAPRYVSIRYTGNWAYCGSSDVVYQMAVYFDGSLSPSRTTYFVGTVGSIAHALTEISVGTYFEPIGSFPCFGSYYSGQFCQPGYSANRLQLSSGAGWVDWDTSIPTFGWDGGGAGGSYHRTNNALYYNFYTWGSY